MGLSSGKELYLLRRTKLTREEVVFRELNIIEGGVVVEGAGDGAEARASEGPLNSDETLPNPRAGVYKG